MSTVARAALGLRHTRSIPEMSTNEVCTDCLPDSAPAQSIAPAVPTPSTSSTTLDPLLDSSTFSPPPLDRGELPRLSIEFCDRCKLPSRPLLPALPLTHLFPQADGSTELSGHKPSSSSPSLPHPRHPPME